MTRPNTVTIVSVFALLIAGCASLLVYNYLKKQNGKQAQGITAVAAATDIAIGTKLEPAHFKLTSLPKEALAVGYHSDIGKLQGRIAVRHISAGDIVTEAKLMPQNGAAGGIMTYIVPQGHRAVTVAVNEVAGVAGFITPNSRVDVVLTSTLPGSNDDDNMSKIILQNVPVLATGQVTEQKEGKPVIVPTVTLDLVPEDAEKLVVGVGARKGSLQLLLRNMIDVASVNTSGTTITKVLGRAERPVAVKSGPRRAKREVVVAVMPKHSVEVIKGGAKTTREFAVE